MPSSPPAIPELCIILLDGRGHKAYLKSNFLKAISAHPHTTDPGTSPQEGSIVNGPSLVSLALIFRLSAGLQGMPSDCCGGSSPLGNLERHLWASQPGCLLSVLPELGQVL